MATMNEILNLIEAADYLRVKPSTIYAWVHQRRLPFRKHGRKLAFLKRDLENWSEHKRVEPLEEFCANDFETNSSLTIRRTVDGSSQASKT